MPSPVYGALQALAAMVPAAHRAFGSIRQALHDRYEPICLWAILALAAAGPAAQCAVDDLWAIARNTDHTSFVPAAAALWNISGDPAAIDVLIEALASDDEDDRQRAADYLGGIGPDAKRALPALETLLSDDDELVRNAAAEAIESILEASPWN